MSTCEEGRKAAISLSTARAAPQGDAIPAARSSSHQPRREPQHHTPSPNTAPGKGEAQGGALTDLHLLFVLLFPLAPLHSLYRRHVGPAPSTPLSARHVSAPPPS